MILYPREFATGFSIRETVSNYQAWLFERTNLVFIDPDGQTRQFLAPKRGNWTYSQRVERRFSALRESIKNRVIRWDNRTSIAYITCTLDTKLMDIPSAWEQIGKKWNNFLTKLRRIYGNLEIVRCFEAQKNGYPHIHALVFFRELREFELHRNLKTGAKTFRFTDWNFINSIKEKWASRDGTSWGFVDVQAFINMKFGLNYILKYITKQNAKGEDPLQTSKFVPNLTLRQQTNYALLWRFAKRAFSISKSLLDLTRERLLNSNPLTSGLNPALLVPSPKWSFCGILTNSGFIPKEDFKKVKSSEQRKAEFVLMLERLARKKEDFRLQKLKDYQNILDMWHKNYGNGGIYPAISIS